MQSFMPSWIDLSRMSKVTVTATIDAPRATVWDLLTDFDRIPEYSTAGDVIDPSPVPVERGTTWREEYHVGPFEVSGDWEIVEYDQPTRLVARGRLPRIDVTAASTLSATDDRTRLRMVTVYELLLGWGDVAAFLDWAVLHRIVAWDRRRTITNLRRIAERATVDNEIPGE